MLPADEIHCEALPGPGVHASPAAVVVRTYPGVGDWPGMVMLETVRFETFENEEFEYKLVT